MTIRISIFSFCAILMFVYKIDIIFAANFDIMPLNINYFGVVNSGKNIIAFGDNGAYLMTTDKGNTWKQYSLHPYGEIRAIVNYNDTLWGVISEGFIIRSTDNGLTWSKTEFTLDRDDRLVTIEVSDNSLYVRSIYNIIRFDKNINFLNKYSDSVIRVNVYSNDNPLIFTEFYIHFLEGKLFVAIDLKYSGFYVFSEDLQDKKLIYLKDKIYHINPSIHSLENIYSYKNQNIFKIYTGLYYPEDDYKKWTYFFPDTNFLKANDSLWYKKTAGFYLNSYYFLNNELYINYEESKYNQFMPNYHNYGIKKYYSEPKDTFIKFNNQFKNEYYTIWVADDNLFNDALSRYLFRAKQCIIEDSIIVKASAYKSLLQTLDNGKSWKLVSYLTGIPKTILNDSTYYFLNNEYPGNEVNFTQDYGNTFIPTKIYDSLYNFPISNTTLFYIDDNGNGFTDGTYLCKTNDYGKTFQIMSRYGFYKGFASNVIKLNDNYLFVKNEPSMKWHGKIFNFINIIDTSFKNLIKNSFDTLYNIHHIIADDLSHFYILATVQDEETPEFIRFEIRETNDTGKTYTTLHRIDDYFTMGQIYEHNKDSIIFINNSNNKLYLWDRKNDKINILYEDLISSNIMIMYLGNRFYILGDNLFLENTDRNDLTQWQPAAWDYGTPSFESVIFNGNVALAKLQDSLRPLNYYRIMPNKITNVKNEYEPEVKYLTKHFYASLPYPLPAKTIVKSKISYDMSFDLMESINGIFNIYGEKIEGKENITLRSKAKATAEIVWGCSSVSDGIYFIILKQNGVTESIPVIVNK